MSESWKIKGSSMRRIFNFSFPHQSFRTGTFHSGISLELVPSGRCLMGISDKCKIEKISRSATEPSSVQKLGDYEGRARSKPAALEKMAVYNWR